jgi:16S rRNA processing protein RimM
MKELLEYLAQQLVDDPSKVVVEQFEEDDGTVVLELAVGEGEPPGHRRHRRLMGAAQARHEWLGAGRVGRAHGLDGSFYVTLPRPALLRVGTPVRLDQPVELETKVVRRAGTDERPIVRLDGVDSREAWEPLRGADIAVPRVAAPALESGEYWAEDLEGCAVTAGSADVGVVRKLVALPSCEMLEVERPGGGADLLVPLVRDAVRSVDVRARRIDIDLAFLGEAGAGA